MAGASAASPQTTREEEMSLFGRRNAKPMAKSERALMSQRESGYQQKLLDQYETPAWVTQALIPHLPEFIGKIWEPACGSGKMVAALRQAGFDVVARSCCTTSSNMSNDWSCYPIAETCGTKVPVDRDPLLPNYPRSKARQTAQPPIPVVNADIVTDSDVPGRHLADYTKNPLAADVPNATRR